MVINLKRVKFYSNVDMSIGYNFNLALDIIKKLSEKEYNINDILEFYNILKFFNKEILDYQTDEIQKLCNDSRKKLNLIIGKFNNNINNSNIEEYLDQVEFDYVEDFFEMLDKYKICNIINENTFKCILEKKSAYLHITLHNKGLVTVYDKIINEALLNTPNSAVLLLDEYEIAHLGSHNQMFFPKSLTNDDKEKMIINYINCEDANLNYLRIIANLQSTSELNISDKTKLLAKRKVAQQEKQFFDKNSGIKMSTLVQFKKDLKKTVEFNFEGQNWEFTYDINWIEENIKDFSTLLNNFIYLFEYVDKQMRWTMVSKLNYMGIFERSIFMRSKRDYPVSTGFNRLNQLADLQMCGYYVQLQKLGVRVEELISWFFNTYLVREFGINNFNISVPSKDSNYLEKCRTLLPEIDSCLKQYNYYVEDGNIDPELVQISSTHLFFKDVKSLLKNKYVYSNGKEYNLISYYFFSNQCMLAYVEKIDKKYSCFYDLIKNEDIKKEDIVKYEQNSLNKLIKDEYIFVDENGFIRIKNKMQLSILNEINNNEVISYWKLTEKERKEVDTLVEKGLLKFDSSLFSKPEQDYLNYCLNKSEFVNSLDLRNMYGHGTQPFGDENTHYSNYIRFLKLFILIIIKINDELCIFDDLNKASTPKE